MFRDGMGKPLGVMVESGVTMAVTVSTRVVVPVVAVVEKIVNAS